MVSYRNFNNDLSVISRPCAGKPIQAYHNNWLVVPLFFFLLFVVFCQSKRFEQTFYSNLEYLWRIFMVVFKLTNIEYWFLFACLILFQKPSALVQISQKSEGGIISCQ